ncbi:lysophospholipid acyltransferase family protein [Fontivita pretiosa]|uniref:lysophospholipid acyltransferase family protein n=1 Tax=Fontivita pretiosa TaxID=2989684 RepID=UPI003D1772B4
MSASAVQMHHRVPRRSWLWQFLQMLVRILVRLIFDLKVYGRRNVPRRGGALLLANHQSFLDPLLFAVMLDRPVCYMAKSELFEKGRFLPWLIRTLHAFPVKRGRADVSAMKRAIELLDQGHLVNVYPEGTRTRDGQIGAILPGVAVIVRRAAVPIIPAVVDGSFGAWPRGALLPRPGHIRVMYGPPMQVAGLRSEQIIDLIDQTLRHMLAELRRRQCES